MQAALDRSHRNPERIGRFAILQPLVVHQQERGLELIGQVIDCSPHPCLSLFLFVSLGGRWLGSREDLHQCRVIIAAGVYVLRSEGVSQTKP